MTDAGGKEEGEEEPPPDDAAGAAAGGDEEAPGGESGELGTRGAAALGAGDVEAAAASEAAGEAAENLWSAPTTINPAPGQKTETVGLAGERNARGLFTTY